MIRGSFIMRSKINTEECLGEAEGNLREVGLYLTCKSCQKLGTDSDMAFLGVPITTEISFVKKLFNRVLTPREIELILTDPINFPIIRHSRIKQVDHEVIKYFPFGMPWEI
jgi:hypothetical protein